MNASPVAPGLPRRRFLQLSAAASGSLLISFQLTGCSEPPPYAGAASDALVPNAFLRVTPASAVILQLNKFDMGQGISEGFRSLVAEELGLLPGDITIEMAQLHPDLRDPEMYMIAVGGSSSIRNYWLPLREAAALTRELLIGAAAEDWGIARTALRCEGGQVRSTDGSHSTALGDLVATARRLPLPKSAPLTAPADFRVIGRERASSADAIDKVTGAARFGIDIPAALTAVLLRCPQPGGRLLGVDDAPARASPGVQAVIALPSAVAVVASSYWAARQGASRLAPLWDKGPLAGVSSASLRAAQAALLERGEARKIVETGTRSESEPVRELSADYHVPFLAHATLEPMNAVASVQADRVDIWSGVQGLEMVVDAVARALDRPREQVHVHTQYMGGGFGRRIMPDACVEAAQVSAQIGAPVRVIWSREDDTRHDFYRPMATVRMRAQLSESAINNWTARVVCPAIIGALVPQMAGAILPAWTPERLLDWAGGLASGRDPSSTEGIAEQPYRVPYFRTDYVHHDAGVPVGFWRSVGHSQNAFFVESFIDELAYALGRDPLALRRTLLRDNPRWLTVLETAAAAADWGRAAPGHFQGLAIHESFQTVVAQVAEVSIDAGSIRVHRVTAAVDCGLAVNPGIVRAQIEGGIVFGLTAALYGEITLEDGAIVQSNFHDYPLLRLHEAPAVAVHIVPSSAAPTGVGEPGVPPLAPAVANAVFAATGKRLRELPLRLPS
jgi:isoquinoline 1-oxidoreductase subunit beta